MTSRLPDLHHPKIQSLFTLWDSRRATRQMPARADFDTLEWWPWLGHLILLDVLDGGLNYRYRVYGSALARYFGRELTGKNLNDLRPGPREIVLDEYLRAVVDRRPIVVDHTRTFVDQGPMPVFKIILPLSRNDSEVDMLLAGVYPQASP